MLLALRFFLGFLFFRQDRIEIDLSELVDQIRQHECVWIIGLEKAAALLRKIGFVGFLIDREEKLFLECEQFFLARVLIKRKLRFIDGAALVGVLHHSQKLFVA